MGAPLPGPPRPAVLPFRLQRLGVIMRPEPGNPDEAGGVINPACARGPDGELYLLPRLVTRENYSRIGRARVLFRDGDPVGVERLGVALEPQAAYERNTISGGGCEDPRVTCIAEIKQYVLTYTAWGPRGPRIAAAISRDLHRWWRLGLVRFESAEGIDFGAFDDKDALLFPEPVNDPRGRPALAMIHRPMYRIMDEQGMVRDVVPPEVEDRRQSMWISYCPLETLRPATALHPVFGQHTVLARPEQEWERSKIGGGTPPIRTPQGWIVLYHGVAEDQPNAEGRRRTRYSAGMLLLDLHDPRQVLYRSHDAILPPEPDERSGAIPAVVFPTGVDVREEGRIDVYYGVADSAIGVARTTLSHLLNAPDLHVGHS